MTQLFKLTRTVPQTAVESYSNLVDEIEGLALDVAEAADDSRTLSFFYEAAAAPLLEAQIAPLDDQFKIVPTPAEEVPEQDWVTSSHPPLEPLLIADWWFDRAGDGTDCPAGKTPIILPAGAAFGSGEHATTKGCLELYADITAAGFKPIDILDFGAGSGILAFAAAKRDGTPVLGIDIDPVSVQTATRNAADNDLEDLVTFHNGNVPPPGQLFPLVFANILANPLTELAPRLAACVAPGGVIILSGYLQEQRAQVHAAYTAQGLTFSQEKLNGEWVAAAFTAAELPVTLNETGA